MIKLLFSISAKLSSQPRHSPTRTVLITLPGSKYILGVKTKLSRSPVPSYTKSNSSIDVW